MDKAIPTDASTQWTDTRPTTCRHRLMDEGKPYPRSSCQACARTIRSGLGNACSLGALTGPASPNDRALLDMAVEALREAKRALESCYQVADWPANGTTRQDDAINSINATLAIIKQKMEVE